MALTTEEQAAVDRLADYNAGRYDATTNPNGFGGDGYLTEIPDALNDTAAVAAAVSRLAGEANTNAGTANTKAGEAAASAVTAKGYSDRFLDPAASAPTTRDDASALQAGDVYLNTTADTVYLWDGAAWVVSAIDPADYYTKAQADGRYATAAQGTKADDALPRAGGTMTGNVSSTQVAKDTITAAGSVAFDVSAGAVQTATFSGTTTITFTGWPTSGVEGSVRVKIATGSNLGATDLDGLNWVLGDGTTSTTFADVGVTLGAYNEIEVWSSDAGTTKYAGVVV